MVSTLRNALLEAFAQQGPVTKAAVLLLIAVVVFQVARSIFGASSTSVKSDHPYGLPLSYLPRWISGTLYSRYALQIMNAAKKRHPDSAYRLVRLDTDITFLPESTVDELASLPNEVASNILALQYDLVGRWTGLSMLQDVNLHLRVVQRRMMPNMGRLTLDLEEEVTNAVDNFFPSQEGKWVEMDLYHTMMQIASRVFSRMVVGPEFCRDEQWLNFSMNFTENVFNSLIFIRYFPTVLHPLISRIIPSVRNSILNIKEAEALLVPVFAKLLKEDDEKRKKSDARDEHGPADSQPLEWFTDLAQGAERDPVKLVHSQILLALGAIHTSLFAEMNMFYDLIANPSYIEHIRAETKEVAAKGWSVESYSQLHKLDSILRESQRMAPPFLIGLRRVMKQDHAFSNGIVVHAGEYVCVPTYSIQNNLTSEPTTFDGLRSYNLKAKEDAWKTTKHQFATTESSVLAFGHGRTACPGRFLASQALKIIFTKILSEFDIRSVDGSTRRPTNNFAHEIVFPDQNFRLNVRRRPGSFAPF